MARLFCLYCGQAKVLEKRPNGRACSCDASESLLRKLERQEQAHLAEYTSARPLSPDDLNTLVQENGHKCPVSELLRVFQHEDAVKECAIRATLKGLIQLVYHKHEGSRLVRWPWASG